MIPLFIIIFACGINFCAQDNGSTLYSGPDFATVLQDTINDTNIHNITVEYGNYILSKPITLKSDLELKISGYWKINYIGTEKSHAETLWLRNVSNVSISGPAIIDGNSQIQNRSVTQANIIINNGSSHIVLRDLNLTNSVNWPLNSAGHDILVDHVDGSYSGNGVIFATAASYNVIYENSIVHDIPNDWGIIAYGGAHNIIFENDIEYNSGFVGIGALSDEWRQIPSHDVLIQNCISYDNQYSGFGASGYNSPVYNVVIQNNLSEFNNQMNGWAGYGGYEISDATNVQVQNNLSYENGNGNSGASGYSVYNTNYVTISNNKSINEGQRSHNGFGILEYPQNNHLIISNNSIIDNQTKPTMFIGINFLNPIKPTDTSVFDNDSTPNMITVYTPTLDWIKNNFNNIN
jgi:hypothetical protein